MSLEWSYVHWGSSPEGGHPLALPVKLHLPAERAGTGFRERLRS
jgi:hypothetical protein